MVTVPILQESPNDLRNHFFDILTQHHDLWLKAKKMVEYPLVPEIMIDDWVNKGHTNVNMFSFVGEQIRSISSKQSKLHFWNRLHPKIAFLCRFRTQTVTWRPNHTILTSSVKVILKAMIDTFFLDQVKKRSELLINSENFFQQQRVLWGWLAGSSRTAVWNDKVKNLTLQDTKYNT